MSGPIRPWRRETLQLYRDILRTCRLFTWETKDGDNWGKVLAASARVEFEQNRDEVDPEVIGRLLVTGQDCLHQAQDQLAARNRQLVDQLSQARTDNGWNGQGGMSGMSGMGGMGGVGMGGGFGGGMGGGAGSGIGGGFDPDRWK